VQRLAIHHKAHKANKLLYLRVFCEGTGLIFQKKNSRAGVGKHLCRLWAKRSNILSDL